MKEVFKYELAIIMNANARIKVYFTDGTTKLITISIEQLASYDALLKHPQVIFDSNNNVFVGRDRFENRDLRPF